MMEVTRVAYAAKSKLHRRAAWLGALGLLALDVGAWLIARPFGLILFGVECVLGAFGWVWIAAEVGKIARGEPSEIGERALTEIRFRKSMKEEQ